MNIHVLELNDVEEIRRRLAKYGYKPIKVRRELNMTQHFLYKDMNLDEKLRYGILTEEDLKMLEQQAYSSGRNAAFKEMDCFRFGLE